MIGTLGRKIIFEVSDEKVLTFLNMTREITSRWAEHEALGVKPKPEFLGPGLQTGTLEITLSATPRSCASFFHSASDPSPSPPAMWMMTSASP